MPIQTFVIHGADKEGFLSADQLRPQARAETADAFAGAHGFPALYVVEITAGAPGAPGKRDAAPSSGGPRLVTIVSVSPNASAFRYLHRVGFLVKRPGNPFPKFVSVGRAPNNDLVLAVESVSKFHAYFTLEGESWWLTDYRSTTGTELNGTRLEPNVPTLVKDGDRVRFGEHVVAAFLLPASLHARLTA